MLHFAHHPTGRFPHRAGEQRIRAEPQGIRVECKQRAVVVEHLLEVRDHPVAVGGVATETSAQVIVDAAPRHLGQRGHDHVQRFPVGLLR